MEDLLAKQLEIHFKDYKEQMIWILALFFLLILFIQFISNLLLSKKIEKFKNDLKKTEVKFSKHSELQIECLKNMYDNIVTLHFAFTELKSPIYFTHETFKSNINSFMKIYRDNTEYFHRNKILLTDVIIEQIRVVNKKMNIIRILYKNEYNNLLEYEENIGSSNPEILYNTPENEVDSIKAKINELNKSRELINFENEIANLRSKVEEYFKELTH